MADRDYDFRVIELELIDPPPLPMREKMDPEKLEELMGSVREKGVVSPLGVYKRIDRFVIIYGHRRFVAAQNVGELRVPCRVHADGNVREEDYKFTENHYREDVNPAEEATWFADLLDRKYDGKIEALCASLHLTESYVNGRLDLLRGGQDVLQALRDRKINLAVARELNKFRDAGWRSFYLGDAIAQGATAPAVQRWRMERERLEKIAAAAARGEIVAVAPSTESPIGSVDVCFVCVLPGDPLEMEFVRVHKDCASVHRRAQRIALQGEGR